MSRYPVYAPFNLQYDATRMAVECMAMAPFFKRLAPAKSNLNPDKFWRIADQRYYDGCEHVGIDNGQRVLYSGSIPSWEGISTRHVKGVVKSELGSNRFRVVDLDGQWEWTVQAQHMMPYTIELLEALKSMGVYQLNIVRIMSLLPGGFGPVHTDADNDDAWEKGDAVSLTFQLTTGLSPMVYKVPGHDKIHEVYGASSVFLFKDNVPHGIPPVQQRRLLLRVHGLAKYNEFKPHIDWSGAVQ